MEWEFDSATDGNIALTGEIDIRQAPEFVLALAFGDSLHQALMSASQVLALPFADHRERFIKQWQRAGAHLLTKQEDVTGDGGRLHRVSHAQILAHEDKIYDGAMIASLSIPWGESLGDENLGGYHLVWTRDMYHGASGLLAAGHSEVSLRALIYLGCTQCPDGGFYQNFWINGEPDWRGVQLDETAFPILLAWQLHRAAALRDFDPYPMVLKAAGYLLAHGPATAQERWEENSGYSPSTLAVLIAALVCAAAFARMRGEPATALHLEDAADFLEAHLEPWTVTTEGALLPEVPRHFIRIHPVSLDDPHADEDANHGLLELRNQAPAARGAYPAKDVVDAGFLELVRYGIRAPGDPLIEDSLRVVDAILKVDTPAGPCWRRYNHDGYGQRPDGGPFLGWGKGHAWPLLTGERGHYELAAGRDARPYIRAMEGLATSLALLPEQIWSDADLPEKHMFFGRPTGGAMPLVWAHAEYLKLVRSAVDGEVFDLVPEVAARYRNCRKARPLEIWKFNRQVRSIPAGRTLRIQAGAPFRLHSTYDNWEHAVDTSSTPTGAGVEFVDIPVTPGQRAPIRFTFFWLETANWERRDFQVCVFEK
jgi:glucoamylase